MLNAEYTFELHVGDRAPVADGREAERSSSTGAADVAAAAVVVVQRGGGGGRREVVAAEAVHLDAREDGEVPTVRGLEHDAEVRVHPRRRGHRRGSGTGTGTRTGTDGGSGGSSGGVGGGSREAAVDPDGLLLLLPARRRRGRRQGPRRV